MEDTWVGARQWQRQSQASILTQQTAACLSDPPTAWQLWGHCHAAKQRPILLGWKRLSHTLQSWKLRFPKLQRTDPDQEVTASFCGRMARGVTKKRNCWLSHYRTVSLSLLFFFGGSLNIFSLFIFYNCIVPLKFLPWEIQVASPGKSQLQQSCYPIYGACWVN